MTRTIDVDGQDWTVRALPREAYRREADPWHFVRVRFAPPEEAAGLLPRETWLRIEEDVPAGDVLDQYEDPELVEVFLAAEEVDE